MADCRACGGTGICSKCKETASLSPIRYSLAQRNVRSAMARASVLSVKGPEKDKEVWDEKAFVDIYAGRCVTGSDCLYRPGLDYGDCYKKGRFQLRRPAHSPCSIHAIHGVDFDGLPLWVSMLVMAAFGICVIKAVMHAIFGKAATAEFMGHLMYDIFLLPSDCWAT